MSRVLITGSNDGLGLAAARLLLEQGHTVVGHARSEQKADRLQASLPGLEQVLVADLASIGQTRRLAGDADSSGRFDAVIHNAGVGYREPTRVATEDGHAHVLAVNVLAPFILTSLMERPDRLVFLSSGLHRSGHAGTQDLDWASRRWNGFQAYSDSKLFDAVLAAEVARRWPEVSSNALEPGWVATKMGGPGAPDDLAQAHLTQAWLAASDDPAATGSGGYFFHQRPRETHPAVSDPAFGGELVAALEELTGVTLPH